MLYIPCRIHFQEKLYFNFSITKIRGEIDMADQACAKEYCLLYNSKWAPVSVFYFFLFFSTAG